MNLKTIFIFALSLLILSSCDNNAQGDDNPQSQEWLIPSNEVFDGGPGKDGIPSVDNPNFSSVSNINFLSDNDLVVGIVHNGLAKAYPHPILDWHEIVNDDVGNRKVALTYCPLTGTAVAWNRVVNGNETTFGVSGKLYNTNLIPYDRATDSYWSQIGLNCINGELISNEATVFSVIETTWATWQRMYPNSQVMTTETGFNRSYGQYPYGDYRTNHNNLIFPVNPEDNRLPAKERVLGVLNNGANKVYSINEFETPTLVYDNLGDDELIIIGSKADNFIVAFRNDGLNDLTINFNNWPVIASDATGNELTISGLITNGPMANTQLSSPTHFMGYWVAFGAFYPNIGIYNE